MLGSEQLTVKGNFPHDSAGGQNEKPARLSTSLAGGCFKVWDRVTVAGTDTSSESEGEIEVQAFHSHIQEQSAALAVKFPLFVPQL
jgi:hypothetical protein